MRRSASAAPRVGTSTAQARASGISAGPLGDGVVHRPQVRHPHEAGDAWGNHRFRGGDVDVSRSSSWAARSSSMSAPAAADDASQASFMSLDDTAFRRVAHGAARHLERRAEEPVRRVELGGRRDGRKRCFAITSRCSSRGSSPGDGPASSRMSSSQRVRSPELVDRRRDPGAIGGEAPPRGRTHASRARRTRLASSSREIQEREQRRRFLRPLPSEPIVRLEHALRRAPAARDVAARGAGGRRRRSRTPTDRGTTGRSAAPSRAPPWRARGARPPSRLARRLAQRTRDRREAATPARPAPA